MKRLFGLLFLESALIGFLHRTSVMFPVDWPNFTTWVRFTPTDQMLMGAIRWITLALSYWLLLSSIVFAVGMVARLPRLARSVEWATLPLVRNAARRAVALSLATSAIAPAMAFVSPTPSNAHEAAADIYPFDESELGWENQRPDSVIVGGTADGTFIPPGATLPKQTESVSTPRLTEVSIASGPPAPPLPTHRSATANTNAEEATGSYRVVTGDNLWSIAADHLREERSRSDQTLSERDIAWYWGRLVELNRLRLQSGNPDLIFPGEHIVLPPADG